MLAAALSRGPSVVSAERAEGGLAEPKLPVLFMRLKLPFAQGEKKNQPNHPNPTKNDRRVSGTGICNLSV